MNSLGMPGAVASQLFLGRFVDRLGDRGYLGRAQWDPAFYIYGSVLLIGAVCWLFVDTTKAIRAPSESATPTESASAQRRREVSRASDPCRGVHPRGLLVQPGADALRRFLHHDRRADPRLSSRGSAPRSAAPWRCLAAPADVEVVPTFSARRHHLGRHHRRGRFRPACRRVPRRAAAGAGPVDGVYFALHGAMAAENEDDPEGFLLAEARKILGERVPIVASFDLHGILTDRMLEHTDAIVIYHTYPHVDFFETGQRAARLLLRSWPGKSSRSRRRVRDSGPGPRRRADHPHRRLRPDHPRGPGRRAKPGRPVGGHVHRQPLHRRPRPGLLQRRRRPTTTPNGPSARRSGWPRNSGSIANGCRPG